MIRTAMWTIWLASQTRTPWCGGGAERNEAELRTPPGKSRLLKLKTGREPACRAVADAGASLFRGQRLPASYANFYIANGLVLVPTFNDRTTAWR